MLGIGPHGADLVPEKPGRVTGSMGEQGLGLGKLQLELISQERPELPLDGFRFVPRPNEAKQEVVRVAHVPEPPKLRVARRLRWKVLSLLAQCQRLLSPATAPEIGGSQRELHVCWIWCTLGPSVACR